jgi:hypothetical protein
MLSEVEEESIGAGNSDSGDWSACDMVRLRAREGESKGSENLCAGERACECVRGCCGLHENKVPTDGCS